MATCSLLLLLVGCLVFSLPEPFDSPHVLSRDIHIVVLVHGIKGNANDWRIWVPALKRLQMPGTRLHILASKANSWWQTFEGVEACGKRLASEIVEFGLNQMGRYPAHTAVYFSIVGHSLGGLIARNALGQLYGTAFWERITPLGYYSFATPHLGARTKWARRGRYAAHLLSKEAGTSIHELLLQDKPQMIHAMSVPDSSYMIALASFRHRTLVGTSHHDFSVPFATALIRDSNPYPVPAWNHYNMKILAVRGFVEQDSETPWECPRWQTECFEPIKDWLPAFFWSLHDPWPLGEWDTMDTSQQLQFSSKTLNNLQKLPWRRLEIQWEIGLSPWVPYPVHSLYTAKRHFGTEWLIPAAALNASKEAIGVFTAMVAEDLRKAEEDN